MKTPVTLIIMDGFGLSPEKAGNAILAAGTPNFDRLWAENPHCRLAASGPGRRGSGSGAASPHSRSIGKNNLTNRSCLTIIF